MKCLQCSQMLFSTVILITLTGTALMASYSAGGICKPKSKVKADVLDKLQYADDLAENDK